MHDPRLRKAIYLTGAVLLLAPFACQTGSGAAAQDRTTDECTDSCLALGAANCGDVGQQCVDQCLRGSTPSMAAPRGQCAVVETTYIDCFWSATAYACDEKLGSVPVGCDDQRAASKACESGAASGGAAAAAGADAAGAADGAGANAGGAASAG